MSHFYSSIEGNRGEATRQGTKGSGIRASCQGWEGSVIVRQYYDEEHDRDMVCISVAAGSARCGDRTLWYGPIRELVDAGPNARFRLTGK